MKKNTQTHPAQNKEAEKTFFDELADSGAAFKPKPEKEYNLVFSELGMNRDFGGIDILEAGCHLHETGTMTVQENLVISVIQSVRTAVHLGARIKITGIAPPGGKVNLSNPASIVIVYIENGVGLYSCCRW